jgi:hypothetical protein
MWRTLKDWKLLLFMCIMAILFSFSVRSISHRETTHQCIVNESFTRQDAIKLEQCIINRVKTKSDISCLTP